MLTKLKRKDLINLIKSQVPSYDNMEDPLIVKLGYYQGGMNDRWVWYDSDQFDKCLSKQTLWGIYIKIRDQYKVK